MRNRRCAVFCVVALIFAAGSAYAHPARKVDVRITGTQLDIVVEHKVSDPAAHFIDIIDVHVNGEKLVDQKYLMQTDNVQKAVYLIPSLKKGDTVSVKAHCSKNGDKEASITVE